MILFRRLGGLLRRYRLLRQWLEWLQRIAAAAQGTHYHYRTVQGQHQCHASLETGKAFPGGVQCAQLNPIDGQQQAVQAQGDGAADDAVQQPDGHAQHHYTEETLDLIHPVPGSGQQAGAAGAGNNERNAHADGQGEQRGGPGHGIAAGGHINQGAGENRGYTGRHHQRGNGPHEGGAKQAATFFGAGLMQFVAQEVGQLQFIESEHGQGQQHKDDRGGNNGRGLLQQELQVEAGTKQRHQ